MTQQELVQAVDDAVTELNEKVREYNSAVEDLRSVLDDNSGACEEVPELDDAEDACAVDHIDDSVIDAYAMKREIEHAISDVEAAADAVVQAKGELETALQERDDRLSDLRTRFARALEELTGAFPDDPEPDALADLAVLVDATERFVRAAV